MWTDPTVNPWAQPGTPPVASSPYAPAAMATPQVGGVRGFFQNNQAGLGAIGAGLMSGRWGNYPGLPEAMRYDQEKVAKLDTENKTKQWLKSQNLLTPELSSFLDVRPDLAGVFIGELFKQKLAGAGTDDLREYGAAVAQGFKGTFLDYQLKLKQAGAQKTIGSIEPGTRLIYDEAGNPVSSEPIPGSEADRKAKAAAAAAAQGEETRQASAEIVTTEVDRGLDLIKKSPGWTTGTGAWITQDIPGFPANDLRGLVETIKANIGFEQLKEMRAASPTGASGLGSLTTQELKSLQAVVGDLELSRSSAMVEYNLKRVKNTYLDIIHGPGQGPPREKLTLPGGGGKPGEEDPMGLR